MIRFAEVSMRYPGGHEALKQVDLHVQQGAMVYLTGGSGSGKTTLLRLILLAERPTQGHIVVNGQNLGKLTGKRIPLYRRNIGFTYQDHRLLNERTVFDNVALPLVVTGHYRYQEIKKRVHAALDKVGLLAKERAFPITLSGGEQQRVGIARAVAHRPALLLGDEPTGNLDPSLSWEIMKLYEEFNRVGVTVLLASHEFDMIKRMNKPFIVLDDGRLSPQTDKAEGPG